ncbi:MAG: helix-turn-helix domain-containing protein [Mesorhizobium sp.]
MSHNATNWAIQQRGLKPATKIVLWHLCDRHNPDNGCFPSQEKLAADCELSRSSLNDHLSILEARGLIQRVQRMDPETKQRMSTSYVFAFEPEFVKTQDVVGPCPEIGHGAMSENGQKPCPKNDDSHVRNSDTNLVREPVIEPRGAQARGEEDQFDILWSNWPKEHLPDSKDTALRAFLTLSAEERRMAMRAAEHYRKAMFNRGKPRLMIPFLRKRLFVDFHDAPVIDKDGDFVFKAGQPEWSAWLGVIRREHGEAAVQRAVAGGHLCRKTRWPEGYSLDQKVTKMATYESDLVTGKASAIAS